MKIRTVAGDPCVGIGPKQRAPAGSPLQPLRVELEADQVCIARRDRTANANVDAEAAKLRDGIKKAIAMLQATVA